ncbi:Dimethylallyltranstransferase [Lentibacillus sp. JNUCC-1]|uniref:polyprenyl synthetase family protein n=1 Tax=Lentibacillus sp. JNUCC-1 TaxID=2654513 RepID=UPI0012E7EF17|nr:farnesyl diphosphate synthase [Lentibacillus sp. JNUCC-1]MUV39683.1 Dimethylallyltranstransferase [Lentibacillus sp. JNUCC-1]
MTASLETFMARYKKTIESVMNGYLNELDVPKELKDSMRYSIEAGGKRIRPLLLMASYLAYKRDVEITYSSAAALEFIHTYSLIHDDLPAMDDDNLRRGKPTNHIVFNEATAILAGDALLTSSFELISKDESLSNSQKQYLIGLLSETSGPKGMVAGQILDMQAEEQQVSLVELEQIHTLKTGELLRFAVTAGAYLAGATNEQLEDLKLFAHYIGLIFQVQDDILDVVGDETKLGKPIQSDTANLKSTYPLLLGIEGAIEQKKAYVKQAKEALHRAGVADSYLAELTDYFSDRDH